LRPLKNCGYAKSNLQRFVKINLEIIFQKITIRGKYNFCLFFLWRNIDEEIFELDKKNVFQQRKEIENVAKFQEVYLCFWFINIFDTH